MRAADRRHHRLRTDPIDDDTAARAPRSRHARDRRAAPPLRVRGRARPRRPPPARPHLPPGLVGLPALPAHAAPSDDALLEDRQWEADHFEDVPGASSSPASTAAGRSFPAIGRRRLLRRPRSRPCRTSSSPRHARGLGGVGDARLPLWSRVGGPPDPRPARGGHPGRRSSPSGWPRGPSRAAGPGRPRRQPRAPRPLRPPALSRPRRHDRPGAPRTTRHNGCHDSQAGDDVPRKGRARRFREARELKQGYDDGLFREGSGTLADVDEQVPTTTLDRRRRPRRRARRRRGRLGPRPPPEPVDPRTAAPPARPEAQAVRGSGPSGSIS